MLEVNIEVLEKQRFSIKLLNFDHYRLLYLVSPEQGAHHVLGGVIPLKQLQDPSSGPGWAILCP